MLSRIENLEENIYNLKKLKENITIDDVSKNKFHEWALRYAVFHPQLLVK